MQESARRLPHRYVIGQPLFITFCLNGSLPKSRGFSAAVMDSGKAFVIMDRQLDQSRTGPLYLKNPEIAGLVVDAIRSGAEVDYDLHAWVVMPNHVHLLLTPYTDPRQFLQKNKGATAREANRILNLTGHPFWQNESYDRVVRNTEEYRKTEAYILKNPIRAGLTASVTDYLFSSVGGLKPA